MCLLLHYNDCKFSGRGNLCLRNRSVHFYICKTQCNGNPTQRPKICVLAEQLTLVCSDSACRRTNGSGQPAATDEAFRTSLKIASVSRVSHERKCVHWTLCRVSVYSDVSEAAAQLLPTTSHTLLRYTHYQTCTIATESAELEHVRLVRKSSWLCIKPMDNAPEAHKLRTRVHQRDATSFLKRSEAAMSRTHLLDSRDENRETC
jgi:hypothetical protein